MHSASARDGSEDWKEQNQAGLQFAASGNWNSALASFATALLALSDQTAGLRESRDTIDGWRATILANLCQSATNSGKFAEAQSYGEKSLALRVALYGESALAVARARNDLAVVLGQMGRTNDALSLLQRAIASVEMHALDHHSHKAALGMLRDNAQRIRMSANRPQSGHGESGSIIDSLPEVAAEFDHTLADEEPLDETGFDLIERRPPTLDALPKKGAQKAQTRALGFDVEYGIPREHHEPLPGSEPAESKEE